MKFRFSPLAAKAPLLAMALASCFALTGGQATAQDTAAVAVGDPAAGQQKAYTCLGCHGIKHYVNVYPSYHVPLIAGQHAEYLTAALQAYRAGTRKHATMQSNAALLSDQDIADIASWFSSLGSVSP